MRLFITTTTVVTLFIVFVQVNGKALTLMLGVILISRAFPLFYLFLIIQSLLGNPVIHLLNEKSKKGALPTEKRRDTLSRLSML